MRLLDLQKATSHHPTKQYQKNGCKVHVRNTIHAERIRNTNCALELQWLPNSSQVSSTIMDANTRVYIATRDIGGLAATY